MNLSRRAAKRAGLRLVRTSARIIVKVADRSIVTVADNVPANSE